MAHAPIISVGQRRRSSAGQVHSTYKNLSSFQVDKFTYMFHALFDLDKNDLIEKADMHALADKMAKYAKWEGYEGHDMHKSVLDVMMIFLECLQDQVKQEMAASAEDEVIQEWEDAVTRKEYNVNSITLTQWLNMWGRLTYGSAGLKDFPCWVQLLPKIFFQCIDLDKSGELTQDQIRKFYKDFVCVDPSELDRVTDAGYNQLTANGDYKLNQENFNFCFSNFLLGRSIYGPGKYIFGVFDNRDIDEKYQVYYGNDDEE